MKKTTSVSSKCRAVREQIEKAGRFWKMSKISIDEFCLSSIHTLIQGGSECWETVMSELDRELAATLKEFCSEGMPTVAASTYLPGDATDEEIRSKQRELDTHLRKMSDTILNTTV